MIECREYHALTLEARSFVFFGVEKFIEQLDRDHPAETLVDGAYDETETAASEFSNHPIPAGDPLKCRRGT